MTTMFCSCHQETIADYAEDMCYTVYRYLSHIVLLPIKCALGFLGFNFLQRALVYCSSRPKGNLNVVAICFLCSG